MNTLSFVVTVEERDIELANALRGSRKSTSCPITQAIRRLGYSKTATGTCTVMLQHEDAMYRSGLLPKAAIEFIDNFDHNREVKPFSFNLELEQMGSTCFASLLEE